MKYLILASVLVSGSAVANEFPTTLCQHGEQQRKVEVVYPQGTPVPCEVHYTKASGTQILWKAAGETGFCEAKATALIEKQKGWGWQCDVVVPQSSENDETPAEEEKAAAPEVETIIDDKE